MCVKNFVSDIGPYQTLVQNTEFAAYTQPAFNVLGMGVIRCEKTAMMWLPGGVKD